MLQRAAQGRLLDSRGPALAPAMRQPRAAAAGAPTVAPSVVGDVIGQSGQGLDGATRHAMESRFGFDFGHVRVHTDDRAAGSALAMGARAYTVGGHVVFGAGLYRPETGEGRRLLAHELAHVVQQTGGTGPAPAVSRSTLSTGRRGDAFEREADRAADAVARGESFTVSETSGTVPALQRDFLTIADFEPTDLDPKAVVSDPQFIDNGILDAGLRGNGAIMSPVFTGLSVFYADGSVMDIPAAANSAFPAFHDPGAPTITRYRRHRGSGKIFPITILLSDFIAAANEAEVDAHSQFLFRQQSTPNVLTVYTNALFRTATAYSGLIAQIWNLGLGVTASIQIFTLSGTLRVMAAGRAAAGAAGVAGNQTTTAVLATIQRNVLKSALTAAETAQVQQVETRLVSVVQRAIQNVNAGNATGAWAQRLANLPATSPVYRATLGNAIHEESFNIIQQEIAAGNLPAGITVNAGRAVPGAGLPNALAPLRPDIRMPLAGGNEAIFDITTVGQAGHAQPYTLPAFVRYVVELLYP